LKSLTSSERKFCLGEVLAEFVAIDNLLSIEEAKTWVGDAWFWNEVEDEKVVVFVCCWLEDVRLAVILEVVELEVVVVVVVVLLEAVAVTEELEILGFDTEGLVVTAVAGTGGEEITTREVSLGFDWATGFLWIVGIKRNVPGVQPAWI